MSGVAGCAGVLKIAFMVIALEILISSVAATWAGLEHSAVRTVCATFVALAVKGLDSVTNAKARTYAHTCMRTLVPCSYHCPAIFYSAAQLKTFAAMWTYAIVWICTFLDTWQLTRQDLEEESVLVQKSVCVCIRVIVERDVRDCVCTCVPFNVSMDQSYRFVRVLRSASLYAYSLSLFLRIFHRQSV